MSQEPQDIFDRIRDQVKADEIVLYMKGSPAMPQCGFSQVTSEILRRLGREFASYDVLQDPALREGIKQYSNWPTIPQLYVRGEFVGGCDIVRSMYESGELAKMLDQAGDA
jgi:monothiol glutaredoxin